jgi:adenylyl- and sulfurtransferase ThiI
MYTSGCSPLNLAGMTSVGITEGVPIWRPLLNHDKKEIYDFAHKYEKHIYVY